MVGPNPIDRQERVPAGEQVLTLLRYTVLAPTYQNSQPWKFAVQSGAVRVFESLGDPRLASAVHGRELDLSLGCAIENLATAAAHDRALGEVRLLPGTSSPHLVAEITLTGHGSRPDDATAERFAAIPRRHTNYRPYDASPLPHAVRDELTRAADSLDVQLVLFDHQTLERAVEALLWESGLAPGDPQHDEDHLLRREVDRLIGRIGELAHPFVVPGQPSARQDAELLLSAPLFGVLAVDQEDRESRLRAGRALERVWLAATAEGVQLHPISRILQLDETRAALRHLLPPGAGTPLVPFRVGYAPHDHRRTPRRPLRESLVPWVD